MVAQVTSGAGAGLRIPATVRIGGMGHRKLGDQQRLRARVREVLRDLDDRLRQTPHVFVVLSPLAEGADRLVAEEVLAWPVLAGGSPARLEVVLPLPEEEYLQDFDPQESKDAFHALLAHAHSVQTLPPAPSRTAAYEQVGRYVVDHCQVLIALWDGRPATGQEGPRRSSSTPVRSSGPSAGSMPGPAASPKNTNDAASWKPSPSSMRTTAKG